MMNVGIINFLISKTSTKLACEVAQNTYLDWKLQNIFTVENARIRRLRTL